MPDELIHYKQPLGPIQQAWVDELRSGKHTQCIGTLGDGSGGRCCLGVLCDLAVEAGELPPPFYTAGEVPHAVYATDANSDIGTGIIPDSVRSWVGLQSAIGASGGDYLVDPKPDGRQGTGSLAAVNDSLQLTFNEIADIIEEKARWLFWMPK